jgi:hypothetical protein
VPELRQGGRVMAKTPIEALADVEAFCDNLPGEGDAIRAYVRGGKDYRLTDADLRAVIAIAKFALSPGIPTADYPGVWAELTGYVQAHAEDRDPINAADLLAYLRELKRKALAPVREWMADVKAGDDRAAGR